MEWTDEERQKVLALAEYERQVCPGCGGYLPETTDRDAQHAYVTDPPTRCHACTALHKRQAKYRDQDNADALVIWPVRKKD